MIYWFAQRTPQFMNTQIHTDPSHEPDRLHLGPWQYEMSVSRLRATPRYMHGRWWDKQNLGIRYASHVTIASTAQTHTDGAISAKD